MEGSIKNTSADHPGSTPYSVINRSQEATRTLQQLVSSELPSEVLKHLEKVTYTTATDGTQIYFPCPFKETEATVALKSVEASVVAAIADLRYGEQKRKIEINLEQTATFLFSTYIATIAGMNKQHPDVKSKLKGIFLKYGLGIIIDTFCRHGFAQSTSYFVPQTFSKPV